MPPTHADRARGRQVVHSLLTGRFATIPCRHATSRGSAGLARSLVDRDLRGRSPTRTGPPRSTSRQPTDARDGPRAGDRQSPQLRSARLAGVVRVSAVMPGGTQISTVESSGRRAYCPQRRPDRTAGGAGPGLRPCPGLIHRDIKPSNLLLDTAGVVWITDFGLAKADDDGLTADRRHPGHAPLHGPRAVPRRGRRPGRRLCPGADALRAADPASRRSTASDRLRLIEQIKSSRPGPPAPARPPACPRDLETVILKAIDKDPRRRYQTADALAEDLRRFLDDEPILARRATDRRARTRAGPGGTRGSRCWAGC